MPLSGGAGADEHEARKRGTLEAAASASGIVRAARRGGMRGPVSARRVFEAAAAGDARAQAVVAEEVRLVAKMICAVITVVDPDLIVLGGGIGRAPGFAESVTAELDRITPVMPAIRVSALGTDAVTDGCLVVGTELAWGQVMTALPTAPSGDGVRPASSELPGLTWAYLVKNSKTWLKNHVGWLRPEQVPAPLVPGQPPLSRCSAQKDKVPIPIR
jgi:predicted NBD/HSP70 family sugar kinase